MKSHHTARSALDARTSGQRIPRVRAATANEVLREGEFAVATYALVSNDILLAPVSIAFWGPGQQIPDVLGKGAAAYALAGGVVFQETIDV